MIAYRFSNHRSLLYAYIVVTSIPLHGLTIIRECIRKHVKWNGYDLYPFESLHVEVKLDSPTPSILSIPIEGKVKVEASNGHESNCNNSEDAHGGSHDKNVDPNDHSNYP